MTHTSRQMPGRLLSALTRERFSSWASNTRGVPSALVSIVFLLYGVSTVAVFAMGGVDLRTAITLLAVPVTVAVALIRPEWVLLLVVLLPPTAIGRVPPMQAIAVLLVTLLGFFLHGRLHLGVRTGIYPVMGIIAFAIFMRADVPAEAAEFADTVLKNLVYYCLLMLAAFQAIANHRLRIEIFVNALLVGIAGATIVQLFLPGVSGNEGFDPYVYQSFSNLAVIGFGITYIRRSLSPSLNREPSLGDGVLMIGFLVLTIVSYNRAAFVVALLCFALVSRWTGKRSFWIVLSLVLALGFSIYAIRDAIVPGGSIDVFNQETLQQVSSGRSVLWEDLWLRAVETFPLGNGWGYMWSLTSVDLFGFEGAFTASGKGIVYPHSDFLFLFVELGAIGVVLLMIYWFQLVRRFRYLSRLQDPIVRYDVRVLAPIFLVMFMLQVFGNAFSLRFVAERFFISAGLMWGMYSAAQQVRPMLSGRRDQSRSLSAS